LQVQQTSTISANLVRIKSEGEGAKSFFFNYDREKFSYKPSQVVRLTVSREGGERLHHPFSVASSSTEVFLQITTRIREGSAFKSVLNSLEIGSEIEVTGPAGTFLLPELPERDIVLLAGGIGITPFRNMLVYARDRKLPHRITLLYSSRTYRDFMFKQEIDRIARSTNIQVVYTVTRENGEMNTIGTGRINQELIWEKVSRPLESAYFVCGTPSFVGGMQEILNSMTISPSNIRTETFRGYAPLDATR
jgi:ferredoxin-NADP reductase